MTRKSQNQKLVEENMILTDRVLELERELATAGAVEKDLRGFLRMEGMRAAKNARSVILAHFKIARLAGYISRVRDHEDGGPRITGASLSDAREARDQIEELLNMSEREFGHAVDSMDREELDHLLGKPDEEL